MRADLLLPEAAALGEMVGKVARVAVLLVVQALRASKKTELAAHNQLGAQEE